MPPRLLLNSLAPAFARRLARTPLRRRNFPLQPLSTTPSRSFPSTTNDLFENGGASGSVQTEDTTLLESEETEPETVEVVPPVLSSFRPDLIPAPSALSALLSRLSLPVDKRLHSELIACLTHPSFRPPGAVDDEGNEIPETPPSNNELLAHLGNSLLGFFASEHLATRFPLLPTEALKSAVTAYVGTTAVVGVGRELGVGVQGGGNSGAVGRGRGAASAGVPVRWNRYRLDVVKTPVARRFRKYEEKESSEQSEESKEVEGIVDEGKSHQKGEKENMQKAVASVVHAFVGLIYQEQGIHAARAFTHAHFLTRHLDMATVFRFKDPFVVLKSVVTKHLAQSGVKPNSGEDWISARMLAETGVNTQAPIFNVGLYLKSGIKLAEGYGSSKKMAQHRAATNALLSFFLMRADQGQKAGSVPPLKARFLPSAVHTDFPVNEAGVSFAPHDIYEGSGFGGVETLQESSKARQYAGRLPGARRTNAL